MQLFSLSRKGQPTLYWTDHQVAVDWVIQNVIKDVKGYKGLSSESIYRLACANLETHNTMDEPSVNTGKIDAQIDSLLLEMKGSAMQKLCSPNLMMLPEKYLTVHVNNWVLSKAILDSVCRDRPFVLRDHDDFFELVRVSL